MNNDKNPNRYTYTGYAEAFTIFQKYEQGMAQVSAEHDVIYAGPSPDDVTEEDKAKLESLGWHIDDHLESFYRNV